MKVYVVFHQKDEGEEMREIFATEELAIKYIDSLEAYDKPYFSFDEVEVQTNLK